jgi:biotin carboxyl carrier protein
VVRRHSATALTNAQSHEGLFLLPLWRVIGKSRVLVTARNLPKTILASIFLAGITTALCLVPYDFTVVADGKLLPETRRNVFAALDGMIEDVPVEEGQTVKAGETVARQRSLDLQKEIVSLNGQFDDNEEQIRAQERKRLSLEDSRAPDADYIEVTSELSRLAKVQDNLIKQQQIVAEKQKKLEITSPIPGKVVTWKVQDLIKGRPVRTGQRLMEIADPTKDWELRIDVPEAKMGHVVRHLKALREDDPDARLKVTFMLATHPDSDDHLTGYISSASPSAEVTGESGNTVRMTVSFPQDELLKLVDLPESSSPAVTGVAAEEAIGELKKNLKVGADVKVKIHCGRAAIGYVWFHEVWEFIQSRILFRL